MSKKHAYKIVLLGVLLVCAILWVVSSFVDSINWFDGYWAVAVFTGVAGIMFIVRGLLVKGNNFQKKGGILLGVGSIVICAVTFALKYGVDPRNEQWFIPLIVAVVALAIFLCYLAVGAKKWDTGENQKVGYKNYYERKEEEEKAKRDAENE